MNINNTNFRKVIESFAPIPDNEFRRLIVVMHEKHMHKGEALLREGQVCREFYFIVRGYVRGFSLQDGKEINVKFYFEDEFACDFESFRYETPSKFYIVAMEDSIVYYGVKSEVNPVLESNTSFYSFVFRFFQIQYFNETEHSNNFKLMSPEERYRMLMEQKPHYLQRIPLIYLASYLGISRETLTRIRKKVS
jgi:CRP-like cAMP-binding protein